MKRPRADPKNLTDEEVLAEFVKRFQCDAAILMYKDGDYTHGFYRYVNKEGKAWVNEIDSAIKTRLR